MDPLKPGDPGVVGRYRLSARLGRAGLGTVFLGRAPGGEQVAVKLVRSDLAADKKFLERFRTDMAAAREVGGTHVAHVLDADADATPPWLVVEHVAGPSLEAAVEAHGAFPERTLRALGAGLAEGLAAVHEAGLTHRDLKPANVLLAADGPRVADYALARALGAAGLNRTGVVETPGLPAPEQVTGGSIGPAIDVFALGGVLCHAAGVAPFGTGSAAELAQRVVRETPDLTELPDWLREIVTDCLKKRPTARPTAADLVARFAAADPATDWLPKATAALLATHAAEAAAASAKRVEIPDADEADTVEPGDAEGLDADDSDGSDPAEEPETAEVAASAALAAPAAPPATGAKATEKTKPRTGAGAARKTDDEADRPDAAADDTEAKPARPAAKATKTKPGNSAADNDDDADDATPVTAPAIRSGKPGRPTAAASSAADAPEDDATPVTTPAARGNKVGKAKPATDVASDTEAPEADATPVATPAARSGKAKPTKAATDASSDTDDAEDDAPPVATPAVRDGKANPTEASSDADDAEGDATPVATPAARSGKSKPTKAATEASSDADDAEDDATTPVPAARDDKPKGKAGAKAADDDATTPVAVPAVRIGKDEDDAPAADPAPPAPESDKPKGSYDGGEPVKVPVVRRGNNAETVKVPRKPDGPAPAGAGAETVKVEHPAASPVGATTVLPAPAPPVAAPPLPTATPAAAATSASQPGSGLPFPLGLTEQRPTPEQRPANPLLWHAVIALLGVTAVGIGLFRLTDSAWRDAQNTILGMVLPGISVLAGLAGLGTLVLAVIDARKRTPQGVPPLATTPHHHPTEANSPR
ncbi:protein kinase domain-containing protein [Embleya sp. MST-111070]|uniref:serine/threonine-protein kinase n=1 Tax=Embleya sp. MST-111070 TaxID=3398231 RepID=UPI003F738BC8